MTIIQYMVPEIRSVTEFFVILGHALPFYPITTQNINILKKRKNKKKKKKKTPGDMWVPHLKKLLL